MIISIKDGMKFAGIGMMMACAVFVCSLFLNYNMDLAAIAPLIQDPQIQALYDAQVMTGTMISAVSGGCLVLTSLVMLCFYIKHYIDVHKQELGICKALGYANWRIARSFWVFGCSVFVGALIGYVCSFLFMPIFYATQNEEQLLPEVAISFHVMLPFLLILLPSLFFSGMAIVYAHKKIAHPVMELLKSSAAQTMKQGKYKPGKQQQSFLKDLQSGTLRSKRSLVFFVMFAAFCFSSMMQMTCSVGDIASELFAVMIFVIGLLLSCTTLFLALSTVIDGNRKTISMMRVFGYPFQDCKKAILQGYRPFAYIGFAIGTLYQYLLISVMINEVFKDVQIVVSYEFQWSAFWLVLIAFVILYEVIMSYYARKIKSVPLKEVMLESQ